jgi:hypothetical protein
MAPHSIEDLLKARMSLQQFRRRSVSPYHERYSFPFLRGTYFAYRKIDVLRLVSIAKTVSNSPRYLDVGCGYGDFLKKIREFIPDAIGIEKEASIFYILDIPKPDFIKIADAHWGIEQKYDIIFVGWMDPGEDFRDAVAAKTNVIVTTLDQGISMAAEFDAHGFEMIASWRTPSWEDVNTEIMNRYYTKMSNSMLQALYKIRGAHNLWYVYSNKPKISETIKSALVQRVEVEKKLLNERYDFEAVLDECGFRYLERLAGLDNEQCLWNIQFIH